MAQPKPPKEPTSVSGNPQMPGLEPPSPVVGKKSLVRLPTWDELMGQPSFSLGIVIDETYTRDRYLSAISKPASSCSVGSVVVLHPEADSSEESVRSWLDVHSLDGEKISIGWRQEGYDAMLKSEIDAVYIIVRPGSQRDYVLAALRAKKHVLLNDPVSTSLAEFVEQQEVAKEHGKFIQFSTMFLHQYRVRSFIDRVLYDKSFGSIHSINAHVRMSYGDVEKVGVQLPLGPHSGSVRVLGRFCVLISTLFFSRVKSYAHSAQVDKVTQGENGEILSAVCHVQFTEGRQLTFDVGYTHSATRQSIELQANSRFATMKDFVIEHPDGLASYRVYEKAALPSGTLEVVRGEAIDVAGGPPQYGMMWRRFVELGHSLDKKGGWDHTEDTAECRELANVALQTKRILIALDKSYENDLEEVIIDDIDYQ